MNYVIQIALPILLALALIFGVFQHFKRDRDNQAALGAAQERIAQFELTLEQRDQQVLLLNKRIGARNQKVLEELNKAEAAQVQARRQADAAIADKVRLAGQLADAQRRYREVLNNDQNVQAYSRMAVPDAVINLLRVANGEANDQ